MGADSEGLVLRERCDRLDPFPRTPPFFRTTRPKRLSKGRPVGRSTRKIDARNMGGYPLLPCRWDLCVGGQLRSGPTRKPLFPETDFTVGCAP